MRHRLTGRRTLLPSLVVVAVAWGVAACDAAPAFRGMAVDPPRAIPGFRFTRADGSWYDSGADSVRPTALFFGYTHCPDVCPTTLADFVRVKRALGADSSAVRFVFVSVDPARDTPALADRYARRYDSAFVGLAGDRATTDAIQQAFGVTSYEAPGSAATGYLVAHASQVFLLDRQGRLRVIHPFGSGWEALTEDLRVLQR